MFKKRITYTDFLGQERTEDHYFHLSKAEVVDWLMTDGDYTLDKLLERLSMEHDAKKIMAIFDDLLSRSYGRVSLDGRRFERGDGKYWSEFKETEAYSILFMELISDANKAAEFVNGIVPKDIADEMEKVLAENKDGVPAEVRDYMGRSGFKIESVSDR